MEIIVTTTTATKTQPKIWQVYNVLRLNKWVPAATIVEKTNDRGLRALRHLRDYGYEIEVRRGKKGMEYRRVND